MSKPKPTKPEQSAAYRKSNPLLQTRVTLAVYEEIKRRSEEDGRSISQYIGRLLEKSLKGVQ